MIIEPKFTGHHMTLVDLRNWHRREYLEACRIANSKGLSAGQLAETHQLAVNCLDKEIRKQNDTGLQTVPSDSVAIGGSNSFFAQCSDVAELVSKYASHLEQSSQDVPAVQRAAFARELSAVLFRSVELALRYGSKG